MMPSTVDNSPTSAPDVSALASPDQEYAAECPQCTTKVKWKGPITDEMLTRTFTRGVDAASGLPNCPRCGSAMQAPAPGVPVAEAIAQAASLEPGAVEPARQLHIPGLRPAFDYASAFDSIIAQRRVVRKAEAIAESKHKDAQRAKKTADEEQNELSQLEDDFETRVAELQLTPAERRRKSCAFERATGTPCPICGVEPGVSAEESSAGPHVATVARQLAATNELRAEDLVIALRHIASLAIDRGIVEGWSHDEIRAVATWLDLPDKVGVPKVLGRAHQVADDGRQCAVCGRPLPVFSDETPSWPQSLQVGTDCPGKPKKAKGAAATARASRKVEAAAKTPTRPTPKRNTRKGRDGSPKPMGRRRGSAK